MSRPPGHRREGTALRAGVALLVACAAPASVPPLDAGAGDSATAAALDAVLLGREHAGRVVVWRTRIGEGAPLTELTDVVRRDREALAPGGGPPGGRRRSIDPGQLALRVPVQVVGEPEMAALFAAAPDGWRAFFARYPGASGVVEVSSPAAIGRDTALVWIARQCGEQCAGVFRVRLARGARGAWAAQAVDPLPAR